MIFDYNFKNYNFRIIFYMLALSTLGVLVVASASGQDRATVLKQIVGVAIALVICIVVSLIDYHKYFKFSSIIYVGCVSLLLAVLLIGKNTKGATRWLRIGGIQIQPSEFVKIGLIVILSWFLSKNQERINAPSVVGTAALMCAVPLGMVYMQPNLSTTIVIAFTLVCIVYAAGLSYKWIVGVLAAGIPLTGLCLYLALFDIWYRSLRSIRHSGFWRKYFTVTASMPI